MNCALIKSVQGKIAQIGRKPFSNGVPSSDAIRSFRARHREMTFPTAEQVSSARLAAEIKHISGLCVTCSKSSRHGSIDKDVIIKVFEHINQHVRKTVPQHEHILLLVDGHSSRQGEAWLNICESLRVLVVKLPANTTHLLQLCDQSVNKCFQSTVRSTRDDLLMMSHLSWANTAFKIKLPVAGHRALTPEIARK